MEREQRQLRFKLGLFLYNAFFYPLLELLLPLLSLVNAKIKVGLKERAETRARLEGIQASLQSKRVIYAHVSSVGEYLQLLPVIEKLKEQFPQRVFALSYFSPSLSLFIRSRKHPFNEVFAYLGDQKTSVLKLLKALHPEAVIFSKFDLWPNLIVECSKAKIPLYLVSATLRADSLRNRFFKFFYQGIYSKFNAIFSVSDKDSLRMGMDELTASKIHTCGDTRVDSVFERAQSEPQKLPSWMRDLLGHQRKPVFLIGSSWPGDEALLAGSLKELRNHGQKLPFCIWAPHECNPHSLRKITELFAQSGLKWQSWSDLESSGAQTPQTDLDVLLVDKVGLLVALYSCGSFAYVGSGLGGVHNVLEPLQAGLAVLFGPHYHNAPEAIRLLELGAVKSVKTQSQLSSELQILLTHPNIAVERAKIGQKFLENQRGAATYCAEFIRKELQEIHV